MTNPEVDEPEIKEPTPTWAEDNAAPRDAQDDNQARPSTADKDVVATRSLWSPPFSPVSKPPQRERQATFTPRRNIPRKVASPKPRAEVSNATTNNHDGVKDTTKDHTQSEQPQEFKAIVNHRISAASPNLFDLCISWDVPRGSDEEAFTWEAEETIQQDAPAALFEYWRSIEGGREAQMRDQGLWHVFAIKDHRVKPKSGAVEVCVTWVGSDVPSWESESKISKIAPQELEAYWARRGGKEGIGGAKKRRGVGSTPQAKRVKA